MSSFSNDICSVERPLKELFPRLFHQSAKNEGKVNEMSCGVDGSWTWVIKWRELLDREQSSMEGRAGCIEMG